MSLITPSSVPVVTRTDLYLYGSPYINVNLGKSYQLFEKAANGGVAEAQYQCGEFLVSPNSGEFRSGLRAPRGF